MLYYSITNEQGATMTLCKLTLWIDGYAKPATATMMLDLDECIETQVWDYYGPTLLDFKWIEVD